MSDTAQRNINRFLSALGQAEGADYNTVVGGGRFEDFSKHPQIVGLRTKEGPSTAAGRYQITHTTFKEFAAKAGVSDFSPASQDKVALKIIEQEGALGDIQAGNFSAAIDKLGGRWASLPSSPYSQPKRSRDWMHKALAEAAVSDADAVQVPTPTPGAAPSLEALYEAAKGPRLPKRLATTKVAAAAAAVAATAPLPLSRVLPEQQFFLNANGNAVEAAKAKKAADDQSFLDVTRAAINADPTFSLVKWAMRPRYEPDGTVATEEELVGKTVEQQDAIRAGASVAERHRIAFDIENDAEQARETMKSGVGIGLAASVLAGLPTGALTGMGAAYALNSVKLGSLALAAQGRRGAAIGSAVAENVGVDLTLTALQDFTQPGVHAEDYILSAAGSSLGAAAMLPGIFRAARRAEFDALAAVLDTAVASKAGRIAAARAELGAEATPEQVSLRAQQVGTEEAAAEVSAHRSGVPASRKLIDDETNAALLGEAADEVPTNKPASPAASAFDLDATEDALTLEKRSFADVPPKEQTPLQRALSDAVTASVVDPAAAETMGWLRTALTAGRRDLAEMIVGRAERTARLSKIIPGVPPGHPKYDAILADLTRIKQERDAGALALRKEFDDDTNAELLGEATDAAPAELHGPSADSRRGASTASTATGMPDSMLNEPHTGQGVVSTLVMDTRELRDVGSATPGNLRVGWDSKNPLAARRIAEVERDYGVSYAKTLADAKPRAVTPQPGHGFSPEQIKLAEWLRKTFLPDLRITLVDHANTPRGRQAPTEFGISWDIGEDISLIGVKPKSPGWQATMVHEFGHVIFNRYVRSVSAGTKDSYMAVYDAWVKRYTGSSTATTAAGLPGPLDTAMRRGPVTGAVVRDTLGAKSPDGFMASMMDVMVGVANRTGLLRKITEPEVRYGTQYIPNVREFSAEQFVKIVEAVAAKQLDWGAGALPPTILDFFKGLWDKFANLFNAAKKANLIVPEKPVIEFFEEARVLAQTRGAKAAATSDNLGGPSAMMGRPVARTDADIIRDEGLDILPNKTPAQRATIKAAIALHRKAEAYPMPDEKRMSKLLRSGFASALTPTALRLLASENAVARMVAAELLESGGGAGGRRTNAAIGKWMHEQEYMGNAINDFQRVYNGWRNAQGGSTWGDVATGEHFRRFNKLVAEEIEDRLQGRAGSANMAVSQAADVIEAGYERMRVSQKTLKTPGWAALPETSVGYMPHRMDPGALRKTTPAQQRAVRDALAAQFRAIDGFDEAFSQQLAGRYLGVVMDRATSGYTAPVGVHSSDAADIAEEAARAMGMSADEAAALAKRVMRAAPAHTRHRLELDMTAVHTAEDGSTFRLLDLFEQDQLALLRSQAQRVSGEAALTKHGIMGSTGMKLLRQTMANHSAVKATNAELEAFDQVTAEFLGRPFGNQGGKWVDRALTANSLISLGGIVFNQAAEFLNLATTLGVRNALDAVGGFGRLRSEVIALSKGQQVHNPVIGSLELYGGAEYGTGHYKMVFPFERRDRGTEAVFGNDDLTMVDRVLRGGSHLQGKLSFWRAMTAAQERGTAEQIVHKALRYIRDGGEDVALADMGFTPDVVAAIRAELPRTAVFDANGRLTEFDINRMVDKDAAYAMVQAVHRGTRQIIQGAFIGETGKWAHSGYLKLLTQFRTFSLIAIDKQWNRQVGNVGTAKALGMLLGTMSFAAPIFMVRAGLASLGRPDQEEFLQKKLAPENIGREVLNYTALSGLSGELLDALSAVTGVGTSTGGRSGSNKSLVGNVVAPALGRANDIWGAVQNNREGTDIHGVVQQLPFSRLPWLLPAVNALRDD